VTQNSIPQARMLRRNPNWPVPKLTMKRIRNWRRRFPLDQLQYWRSADGVIWKLKEMESAHIINLIEYLETNSVRFHAMAARHLEQIWLMSPTAPADASDGVWNSFNHMEADAEHRLRLHLKRDPLEFVRSTVLFRALQDLRPFAQNAEENEDGVGPKS